MSRPIFSIALWTLAIAFSLSACGGSDAARIAELERELEEVTRSLEETSASTSTVVSTSMAPSTASSPSSTASSVSTSTSSTTTTTLPNVASPESEAAFKLLAESRSAVDSSKQIEAQCGVFGLIVLADRIEFFQWDGQVWLDKSELLGPDGEMIPEWVKSHDFTGDGYLDLFVQYRDPFDGGLLGSLFWQDNCKWSWATFVDDFGGRREMVRDLRWSSSRGDLQGTTLNWDGYTTYFLAKFDPLQDVFLIEDIPFSPPPPACVDAFKKIRRLDTEEFEHSWAGVAEIRYEGWWMGGRYPNSRWWPKVNDSLEKCRPADWIAEAERNRSAYSTHYDAIYYGQPYALLLDEHAPDVLQQLCSYQVYFYFSLRDPGEREESGPLFNTDRAIACD